MTTGRQLVVVVVLAAGAVLAWLGFDHMSVSERQAEGQRAATPGRSAAVVVDQVVFDTLRLRVDAVGTARARRSATLYSATAGEIQTLHFSADDEVEGGDVLLELDREAEELAVELARVRLADAERVFNRLQRLSASGAAAQATLDEARTGLEASRIELRQSEVALADRFVVAPFSGRVGLSDLDIGDRIGPDTEIATLDDRASLLVRFDVPEALLGRVVVGNVVTVVPWSESGAPVDGGIVDVGSRVSPETRTFPVRAEIPNPQDRLRPGMSFRVTLTVIGGQLAKVPEIAIQWGGEGSFVWVVTDGTARRVPVIIVQRQDTGVLVEGDIRTADTVVVEGLHRMREGVPVTLVPGEVPRADPLPAQLRDAGS